MSSTTELTGGYLDLTGAVLTCGCHSRMRRRGIGRSTTAREEEEGLVEGPRASSSGAAQPASLGNRREEEGIGGAGGWATRCFLFAGGAGVRLIFFCGVGGAM